MASPVSFVGRRVGHYRILDALGAGGMGEVFLAEDTRLRRPVALKILGPRLREDAAGCERLAREARVASVVNHPGIAVVYETGTLEVASRDRLKDARRRLDLEDARSGGPIHAASVDGTLSQIFAAQDRLVAELRKAVRFQVAGETRPDRDGETTSVEAYEAFTRGLVNLRAHTRESLERAAEYFERAVALDPAYAEAHLQLGVALGQKASFLGGEELHERSIASVRRALERRPDDAVAWRELAASQLAAGGRDAEALESARRAVELDAGNAATHAALARVRFIGFALFEEAADGYERALELNPEAGWYALQLSLCAVLLGRLQRAESAARQALVLQEAFLSGRQGLALVGGFVRLGQVAALRGRPLDAVALFRREEEYVLRFGHALAERTRIEIHTRIGGALRAAGEVDAGTEALRKAVGLHEERLRLGSDDPFTRYYAACARAALGDVEGAAVELERALERRRAFVLRRAGGQPELAAVLSHLGLSGQPELETSR